MIFFKSKRIRSLERTVEYLETELNRERQNLYKAQSDFSLLLDYLGVHFEDVKAQRLIEKKGGPERSR